MPHCSPAAPEVGCCTVTPSRCTVTPATSATRTRPGSQADLLAERGDLDGLFSAAQDVHDGDVSGGYVDSGVPGIWRRVGGHGGGDLVIVSRRGEQLAAVSVAGPVAGMLVPGTGGR